MGRRLLLPTLASVVGLAGAVMVPLSAGAVASDEDGATGEQSQQAPRSWPTDFQAWTSAEDFAAGESDTVVGVDEGDGAVRLQDGSDQGSWTSPWHDEQAFSRAVPSWQVDTPGGSSVDIELQVRTQDDVSGWYRMGTWAFDASAVQRQTHDGQSDGWGEIATDEYMAADGVEPTGYRLRVVLNGSGEDSPVVRQLANTTANPPAQIPGTSEPIEDTAVELDVPSYSQMVHSGEYPQFGGGGEVWCSPTSTTMVMEYYGVGPSQQDIDSLPPDPVFDENGRVDGQVDWAAIHTWDYTYDGAGNWAFNTAYASSYGLDASVQRKTSLREVEELVRAGVPVVITIRWDNNNGDAADDLQGAPIPVSNGHLMVVVGFTESGDPIVNDPAAASNDEVRRVYQRDQFEYNWLRSARGLTYVITDPAQDWAGDDGR